MFKLPMTLQALYKDYMYAAEARDHVFVPLDAHGVPSKSVAFFLGASHALITTFQKTHFRPKSSHTSSFQLNSRVGARPASRTSSAESEPRRRCRSMGDAAAPEPAADAPDGAGWRPVARLVSCMSATRRPHTPCFAAATTCAALSSPRLIWFLPDWAQAPPRAGSRWLLGS